MKKTAFTLALGTVTLIASTAVIANHYVDEGSMTFNGLVVGQTCTLINKSKQKIDLPVVSNSDLDSGEKVEKEFTLEFGGCTRELNKNMRVAFSPAINTGNISERGNLVNTRINTGGAENVELALYNGDTKIDLNSDDLSQYQTVTSNNIDTANLNKISFTYKVRYQKTNNEPAKLGRVQGVVNYKLYYN